MKRIFSAYLLAFFAVGSLAASAQSRYSVPEFESIAPIAGDPVWSVAPTHEEIKRRHPDRAADREQAGQVDLLCRVRDEAGHLGCAIQSETPEGWSFGRAALRVADLYRIAPIVGGQPTLHRRLALHVDFSDVPKRQRCDDCGTPVAIFTIEPQRTRRHRH